MGSLWPLAFLRKSQLICGDHNGNLIRPESRVFEEAGEHRVRHLGFNGQSIPHLRFLLCLAAHMADLAPLRRGFFGS